MNSELIRFAQGVTSVIIAYLLHATNCLSCDSGGGIISTSIILYFSIEGLRVFAWDYYDKHRTDPIPLFNDKFISIYRLNCPSQRQTPNCVYHSIANGLTIFTLLAPLKNPTIHSLRKIPFFSQKTIEKHATNARKINKWHHSDGVHTNTFWVNTLITYFIHHLSLRYEIPSLAHLDSGNPRVQFLLDPFSPGFDKSECAYSFVESRVSHHKYYQERSHPLLSKAYAALIEGKVLISPWTFKKTTEGHASCAVFFPEFDHNKQLIHLRIVNIDSALEITELGETQDTLNLFKPFADGLQAYIQSSKKNPTALEIH
jgi:hypothetical protein